MKHTIITIAAEQKDELVNSLKREIQFTYTNEAPGMLILAGEEYKLQINSNQLYFIVIKSLNASLEIDIVCGGGGYGPMQASYGSEASFVNSTIKLIKKFCEEKSLSYNERS